MGIRLPLCWAHYAQHGSSLSCHMGQADHYTHLSWDEETVECTMCKIETVLGIAGGSNRCTISERFPELGYDLFVVIHEI